MTHEKEKLERKREKLLEAHYADAIPLDLMKIEQDKIAKALLDIDDQIAAYDAHYETIENNLVKTLDLIEDCGSAYKHAPDKIKRAFNQAIFERILVYDDGRLSAEFNEPFGLLLDLKNSGIFYGHSDKSSQMPTDTDLLEQNQNPDQIFFDQGFNKDILVRVFITTNSGTA